MPEIHKLTKLPKVNKDAPISQYYPKEEGTFIIHDKSRYDAFQGTRLEELLRHLNIQTVIVGGVMTNLCCETTARRAFVLDFDILFLKDGTATSDKKLHDATLLNISFGFGKIHTCQEVTEILESHNNI